MRVLVVCLILVGCGAESGQTSPSKVVYRLGAETVNIKTCAVDASAVDVVEQDLELSPAELAAHQAVCAKSKCEITENYETRFQVCGTQPPGKTKAVPYRIYSSPF